MQRSFFEISECYARLDKGNDPLVKLSSMIDWKSLDVRLEPLRGNNSGLGGRPRLSALLMVKCLLLQSLYNLSDDACEYQINDRLSFKRFLGLSTSDKAPDAKTIWLYRERLKHSSLYDGIFAWFLEQIDNAGYIAQEGQIIDATFVPSHNPSGKHKKQLAEEIPLTPAQFSQIDLDATFTKKGNKSYHGYKDHIQVDNKYKIIRKHEVTTASVHDSQEFANLIDETNNTEKGVWADSAYRSEGSEEMLSRKNLPSQVHERAYRNTLLTDEQKAKNKEKSSVRARVEHVFGQMNTAMGGLIVHVIGVHRVKVKVTLKNLAYNMQRFVFLLSRAQRDFCI
jgi:transposase, IS5 family